MSLIYCDHCDKLIDSDLEVEHLDEDHKNLHNEAAQAYAAWLEVKRRWDETVIQGEK